MHESEIWEKSMRVSIEDIDFPAFHSMFFPAPAQ